MKLDEAVNECAKEKPVWFTPRERAITLLSTLLGHPPFPPLLHAVEDLYREADLLRWRIDKIRREVGEQAEFAQERRIQYGL